MNIDERKFDIVKNEDGSITCTPKPFIPTSNDIEEYWQENIFDKRQGILSDIEYIYKVACYVNDKHKQTACCVLRFDKNRGTVEPSVVFTEEYPFTFNSIQAAEEAIAIIGQEILLTLYKE